MYRKISFRSVPKPGPGNRAGFFIARTRGTPKTPWVFCASTMAQNLLEGAAENIAKRAAQLAEEGNVAAIRICMNRPSPVGQHNPVAFELPPIHSTQDWWDEEEESEGHVRLRVERMIAQGKARPDDRFFYVSWRR
jgi:hypothetical protein